MTRNQIQAFIDGCESGALRTKRAQVYRLTRSGKWTLQQIERYLPLKMSTISGRVSELLDLGLLRECKAGVFEPVEDLQLAQELSDLRMEARYQKWRKQGEELGFFARITREFYEA